MGRPANLQIRVTSDSRQARQDLNNVETQTEGTFSKLKTAGPAAAAAIGVAVGAALIGGISKAMEQGKIKAKLGAQLGATPAEAEKYGKVAGQLYAKGIGEDFQSAADAIKATMQQGLLDPGATEAQIKEVSTKVSDLASTFDQESSQVARAVATMMKTGMAKSSGEAMDILTKGFQGPANAADDLLDTFSEYSTQFRQLGLDGKTAMGLLSQGMKGGARDADTVADALKEFTLITQAMGKDASAAMKTLGLNATDMQAKITAGGPGASQALGQVLEKLRAVKDPADQSALAVSLFGTKAEDLQGALYSLDPTTAVKALGDTSGAAGKLGDSLRDNATARFEEFKRTTEQKFVGFISDKVLPIVDKLVKFYNTYLAPAISKLVDLYKAYLSPILEKVSEGFRKLKDKLAENKDKFEPLYRIMKEKVLPILGKLVGQGIEVAFKALGKMIDAAGWLADKLSSLVRWLRSVRDWFGRIKVPSWLSSVGSWISNVPNSVLSVTHEAGTYAAPEPKFYRYLSGNNDQPMNLTVVIDGQQLQARITRTVNGAMQADGARYIAGAWS